MKYLPLIWAGIWRKPMSTVLIQLSVAVAFLLFAILQRVEIAFTNGVDAAGLDVLHVQPKYRGLLPVSYLDEIRKTPGVAAVTPRGGFEASYGGAKSTISGLAVDPQGYFAVHQDYHIEASQLRAFQENRIGAAVTAAAAKAHGWKIGERVSLHSRTRKSDGSVDWPLDIVAIFEVPQSTGLQGVLLRYDYFDSARSADNSTADQFLVRAREPGKAEEIAATIDRMFENSAHETRTIAEKELAQTVLKQFGDLQSFTRGIVSAVFFTLLFLTVTAAAQSVRERIPEFAVLKTLGYSDAGVLTLLVIEGALLCLIPALLGLAAAVALFAVAFHFLGSLFGMASLPASVAAEGIAISLFIALVAGLSPAWRIYRMTIVDGLAAR